MKSKLLAALGLSLLCMVMIASLAEAGENGTVVVGNKTWLKMANCFGFLTWDDAKRAASSLANGQCGLSDGSKAGDWRLPSRTELLTVCVSKDKFVGVSSAWTKEDKDSTAYLIGMGTCGETMAYKVTKFAVIPVKK